MDAHRLMGFALRLGLLGVFLTCLGIVLVPIGFVVLLVLAQVF